VRWVAFLRAINTGNRRVTGDRLASIFESLGFEEVSSFQASGNVIFSAVDAPDRSTIEAALEDGLGYAVPTSLRSRSDIERIVADDPFTPAQLAATEGRIQVMFLRDPMPKELLEAGLPETPSDDLLELRPSEVFWLPRRGISGSLLSPPSIEKLVGPLTVRTLNTVARIHTRL
jgi:uncharacterized protein (DUF1697 family)